MAEQDEFLGAVRSLLVQLTEETIHFRTQRRMEDVRDLLAHVEGRPHPARDWRGESAEKPCSHGALNFGMPKRIIAAVAIVRDRRGHVLLIKRGYEPYRGLWALPGGIVEDGEDPAAACLRELEEETGVQGSVTRLRTTSTGDPKTPPALALVYEVAPNHSMPVQIPSDGDATDAQWFSPLDIPSPLAFDHRAILENLFA